MQYVITLQYAVSYLQTCVCCRTNKTKKKTKKNIVKVGRVLVYFSCGGKCKAVCIFNV